MNERDMEDLIASYPDDFFATKGFKLKGRQQSFAGVGRFDLLFEDRFDTRILMELKADSAKYEVATQLAKYKDELQARGEKHILMWLVAPQIPNSVREFLDRIGIEYSEIHFTEFRRIAERHGISLSENHQSETNASEPMKIRTASERPALRVAREPQVSTGAKVTEKSPFLWSAHGHDLVLKNPELFSSASFATLIDNFERAVPSRRNGSLVDELRRWAGDPASSQWPHKSNASLLRWVTTSSYRAAVPHAYAIWKYLFGEPAPTWYIWRQSKGYDFDPQAWKTWFESLSSRPAGP
ncbi:MAG: endonuclease NucS [Acidobacteriota bacterium]|nr:endonuclease NucS [Acidobacteriota bacterium]